MHHALVVDDLAAEREKLTGILRSAGWLVVTAASGEEAVDLALRARPSIIFMDIMMPNMDGYQACRKILSAPDLKSIPVVFVSTKSQRADHVWARMQGGKELISKPYTEVQVLDALKHAA
jgi:twitching motility two-component system response regulator PilH